MAGQIDVNCHGEMIGGEQQRLAQGIIGKAGGVIKRMPDGPGGIGGGQIGRDHHVIQQRVEIGFGFVIEKPRGAGHGPAPPRPRR